jgi:hypothetical protein
LESPAKEDIYWAKSRFEAVDFAKVGKNYVVACYAGATSVRSAFIGAMQIDENVNIDILAKVTTSVENAVSIREAIRGEIYRIVKENEVSTPGYAWIRVNREFNKVESPDLVRLTIQVMLTRFQS